MSIENYERKADSIRLKFNSKRDLVNSNSDLNQTAKQRQIDENKAKYQAEMDQLHESYKAEKQQRLSDLSKELFSMTHKLSDTEQDKLTRQVSYRDAVARATATKDGEELSALLRTAQLTGDDLQARAVALVSKEHGYFEIAAEAVGKHKVAKLNELTQLEATLTAPSVALRFNEGSLFILD
jgi:DNA anti-recombination protein RmuC